MLQPWGRQEGRDPKKQGVAHPPDRMIRNCSSVNVSCLVRVSPLKSKKDRKKIFEAHESDNKAKNAQQVHHKRIMKSADVRDFYPQRQQQRVSRGPIRVDERVPICRETRTSNIHIRDRIRVQWLPRCQSFNEPNANRSRLYRAFQF
jgi:hypothetical protein